MVYLPVNLTYMKLLKKTIFTMFSGKHNACMEIYSGFKNILFKARSKVSKATTWIEILKSYETIIGLSDISVLSNC